MTTDQADKTLILEILHATRPIPRTVRWLADELHLAGRRPADLHALLQQLEQAGLIQAHTDPLGLTRYTVTEKASAALAEYL